ncbi:serine acetyltransferase [Myxococcota bacterium]|nr:serine acetyltransferase [Myxococcota bacterium]
MSPADRHSALGADARSSLTSVVDELCRANDALLGTRRRKLGRQMLPSREAVGSVIRDLTSVFFPGHFGAADLSDEGMHYFVGHTLDSALIALEEQVRRGLRHACTHTDGPCEQCDDRAAEITEAFASKLPAIRALLGNDAIAAYQGDPAATSVDEAVFSYPGIKAITYYRVAHALHGLGVPLIPRMISELAHADTGVDIHPGATIGGSFFIDHGTGVVIGETSILGERVRLYQGVTLGAKSFALDESGHPVKGVPRHPIVEDDVVIYAGATILGRITIGAGSTIGGNVWLTRSVPAGTRVSQAQARHEEFFAGAGI